MSIYAINNTFYLWNITNKSNIKTRHFKQFPKTEKNNLIYHKKTTSEFPYM